jgi:hypothetical protein
MSSRWRLAGRAGARLLAHLHQPVRRAMLLHRLMAMAPAGEVTNAGVGEVGGGHRFRARR